MGVCASSKRREPEPDSDETVVYVMDGQGCDAAAGGGGRKVASLYSHKGKKRPNQDAVILCQGFGMEDGVFCGAFDGHGRCGQFISKLARDYLPFLILSHRNALLLAEDDDEDPPFSDAASPSSSSSSTDGSGGASPARMLEEWREACAGAFEAMDRELKLQANLDCGFSGTTAVCAIKQGRDLVVANVGDSRAVLATISESGCLKAVQLTTDQKPNVPGSSASQLGAYNSSPSRTASPLALRQSRGDKATDMARTSPPPLAALTLLLLVIFFVFHSGAAAARHLPEEGVRDGAADGLELLESAAAGNGNDELSAVSEMMGPAEEASACEEEGNDDVDDERLQRRMLRDAPHLDYIYTQRRGKP